MPNELKNLELDEVSLVGKAANGKKFLIFKSMQNSKEGIKLTKTKPAGANAGAEASVVSKADLNRIEKAIELLSEENKQLKKKLHSQTEVIRKKDFVEIAKSNFSALGAPEEVAEQLMSLEALSPDARTPIINTMKRSNALAKEAKSILMTSVGYNSVALAPDESASRQIDVLAKAHIAKSENPIDLATARVMIRKLHPELAKAEAEEYKAGLV